MRAYTTSYRDELDRGVEFLFGWLAARGLELPGPVLECACGRGRNALPLAARGSYVLGLDHARNALAQMQARAVRERLTTRVCGARHDLREPLPVADGAIGMVLDITAVDNLVGDTHRRNYGLELVRVLRPGGLLLVVTFDRDDGYYRRFAETAAGLPDGVVQDPHTGVHNRLFRAAELDAVFLPPLTLLAGTRFDFLDEAARERWTRRFHLRLYRKPDA